MEVIQEKGHDLGDVGQALGMLEQLSQMEKNVIREFTKIDKELVKAKKSKVAGQYPNVVANIEGQIGALKSKWEEMKAQMLSGEFSEDLRDTMEEIFEGVGEIHRSIGMLRQLGSVAKMIKSAGKEITRFEKEIARQRKAGKDTVRLDEFLATAKSKMGEITALSKQSGFDPEELFDLMQELEAIGREAEDELERVIGVADSDRLTGAVLQALRTRRLGF